MKNKKKIISAIVAAVLCAQTLIAVPFTASAAVTIPQDVNETLTTKAETTIVSEHSLDSENTAISLGGAQFGSFLVDFDITISGALHKGALSNTGGSDTYITFNSGKIGPYISANGHENGANKFAWVTNKGTEISFSLEDNVTYTMKFKFDLIGKAGGKAALEIINKETGEHVAITGSHGDVTVKDNVASNLSLRNYSSYKDGGKAGISNMVIRNAKMEVPAAIFIGIVKVTKKTPEAIDPSFTTINPDTGKEVVTKLGTDETEIVIDSFEDTVFNYKTVPILEGEENSDYTATCALTLPENPAIVNDKTESTLTFSNSLAADEYNLVLKSQIDGDDRTIIECPIKIVKNAVTDEDIANAFKSRIKVKSAVEMEDFKLTDVYDDVQLDTTWGAYDVTWESDNEEVIGTDGIVKPERENTDVNLTASIMIGDQKVSQSFKVTVRGADTDINDALDKIVFQNDRYAIIDQDNVTADFNVLNSYAGKFVTVSYKEANDRIVVDENGRAVIYPDSEENSNVTLVATATYSKDGVEYTTTKDFAFKLNVNPEDIVNDALKNSNIILNADDEKEAVNFNKIQSDLKFANKSGNIEFTNWNVDNAFLTMKDTTAVLCGNRIGSADGKITVTATYVKNGKELYTKEIEQPITVVLDTNMENKYIARCDAASSANFAGLPQTGDEVTGNINLPTKGIFGSDIEWSSSSPTVISNTGVVTRKSTRQVVDLKATISKGASMTNPATYTINGIVVPALVSSSGGSGGSSGGSGGGSTGSSNINSTVSSTGNKNSNVSYKGNLTPNTSLEKGDITTAQVSSFSDMSGAAWAKEAVTALYNKGIINGKSDSTFAPNDDITRAEFAKIVVKAFGLEDTSANVADFSDVKSGDWFYTSVASAYNKGIIKGYEDGRFGVSDKITRQDMAVIIYRAAQAAGKTIAPVKDAVTFDDNADIASYAAEAVSVLQKGGVINGMTATTFAPKATATRAQAAQMIYGIVK